MALRFWAKTADHHIHVLCVLHLNSRWANNPADQITRMLRNLLCDLLGQTLQRLIARTERMRICSWLQKMKKVRDVQPESL
jgi:hypothetical protein